MSPSNVVGVIEDVDGVKDDLSDEMTDTGRDQIRVLESVIKRNIDEDADWRGHLKRSVSVQTDSRGRGEHIFKVSAGGSDAPYAALVEFGTASKTNTPYATSREAVTMGGRRTFDLPFETPDIDFNAENPLNFEGHPKFYGFVKAIEQWMEEKDIEPRLGDMTVSAAFISVEIIESGQYAHPYIRPAIFERERYIEQAFDKAVRRAVR